MAHGDPITSPWLFYDSPDYLGRHITMTVTFNGSQVLTGGTVVRDAGCLYTKILIGTLDAQGLPTGTTKTIDVSNLNGSRSFTQAQLNAVGLTVVNDINGFQITAAP